MPIEVSYLSDYVKTNVVWVFSQLGVVTIIIYLSNGTPANGQTGVRTGNWGLESTPGYMGKIYSMNKPRQPYVQLL